MSDYIQAKTAKQKENFKSNFPPLENLEDWESLVKSENNIRAISYFHQKIYPHKKAMFAQALRQTFLWVVRYEELEKYLKHSLCKFYTVLNQAPGKADEYYSFLRTDAKTRKSLYQFTKIPYARPIESSHRKLTVHVSLKDWLDQIQDENVRRIVATLNDTQTSKYSRPRTTK